ncbi:class I SAM-dependent methyltransferase [Polynucleobacter sp. Ross1-W9]|uniref:class I SAM-dependent methyltransferase n=1 Tax=Polynucleobacter parvulilacunae TaxID=1855631 RepID=UPI001C0E790B|nr:class I SAM-dependent methyltransferase [Polynucleobacter parvulilacunae]MBU3557447.1 class I SAM-dependent methyltransferase [Polynucleobacter parvulilacunae]
MALYRPEVFNQADIESAKKIILTEEGGVLTEERWSNETPWLVELIINNIPGDGLILDYGCGVGRIAKILVEKGFSVVGVDISPEMRSNASKLLFDKKFIALDPETFDAVAKVISQVDVVISIWVLQHCFDLKKEIKRIYDGLKIGGVVFILDMKHRAVPTYEGWVDDGLDVKGEMEKYFTRIQDFIYNPPGAPITLIQNAYIAIYRKK